ncbi:hypothetical protein H1R20_g5003, partial [Candolleomyces eurysporus]
MEPAISSAQDATTVDLSPTYITCVQAAERQYLQPELSLKMDKIFEETHGRDLRDVLSDAKLHKHDRDKDVNSMKEPLTNSESVQAWKKYIGKERLSSPSLARNKIKESVQDWFQDLVGDDDVLKGIKALIEEVLDIVALTSPDMNMTLESAEDWKKTLLDIGIFRFPDIDHPYIRVYHIRLSARASSERGILSEKLSSSVTGKYRLREYKPRESVIKLLSDELKEIAAGECERLLRGGYALDVEYAPIATLN